MLTETSLCDDDATVAIAAVRSELLKLGKPGVIAVVDNHGETIAVLRMKGAAYGGVTVATNKAYTAARMRRTTFELGRGVKHPEFGYDITYFGDPRYVGFGGGVPVLKDGAVVGAVGVSGLSQVEDETLANVGVAAILTR
jgi:glc operon protein GlcG